MSVFTLVGVLAAMLVAACVAGNAGQPELRGLWVDTWHSALRTPAEVEALVRTAREGNFNALFAEVRKRGDAYYRSRFEPLAWDVQPGFDPLAYLISLAHNPNLGRRIEVHAWIVTYNVWNNQSTLPPQQDHPYRLHPEWLTESVSGQKWDGSNYAFDPGHPDVQQHTYNVAMDIISRYDIDGLHFDYIRYAGNEWGYNPVAVALFNAANGESGRPAPNDSWWMQWRRDCVTRLLRRVYISAAAIKPEVKISAATITWTPTATTFSSWLKAAPWSKVLQDWRGWMEEGILDLNVPMAYFRQETHATAYLEWSRFAKQHRFERHVAVGLGGYLNTISNTVVQIRNTRVAVGPAIPPADGVVVYSYASPSKDGLLAEFVTALTSATTNSDGAPPVFAEAVETPLMPWKTNGTVCGATGRIVDSRTGEPIHGARVELCGEVSHLATSDANGVYAELLKGITVTSVVASAKGYRTKTLNLPEPRRVVSADFSLDRDDSPLMPLSIAVSAGLNSVVVTWETTAPARGRVIIKKQDSPGDCVLEAGDNRLATRHSVLVGELPVVSTGVSPLFWLRIINESEDYGTNFSHAIEFSPAQYPMEIGPWAVRLVGDWSFTEINPRDQSLGFWHAQVTTGEPNAIARWIADVKTSGFYDIEFWAFPATGSFGALYAISTPRTNLSVRVNHSPAFTNGVLATQLFLRKGERTEVRTDNRAVSSASTVATCVFRWKYRADQERPLENVIPVWWSEHFFGTECVPTDDSDADGAPNYAEYVFGTDPTDDSSHYRLWLEKNAEDGWNVCFSPLTLGRSYTLEFASDISGSEWKPLSDVVFSATGTGVGVFRKVVSHGDSGFYRIKVQLR